MHQAAIFANNHQLPGMNCVTAAELKDWIAAHKDFELLDVREEYEHDAFNIGGLHIPLGDIGRLTASIPKEKPVVVYCERGIRSSIAMQRLESLGFSNLYNLTGGMKEWKKTNP